MAILEKEVWINLNGYNIKYYEEKGYDIPKRIDKRGKLRFIIGSKILIKIEDLPKSGVRVTKICDDCGKYIPNQKYDSIILSREKVDGLDRCYECGKTKGSLTYKQNTPYEESLEYFALSKNKAYLLEEFSIKNIKKPSEISKSTRDIYWWNCPKCKSEYDMPIIYRTNSGSNCPYCAGQRVNYTNCLWTTNPDIAVLLIDTKRGYEITAGTGKRENCKCPNCSNVENKRIVDIINFGFYCSKCSDGIPYPEKFMISVLDQLNLNFKSQKIFNWSKNIEYKNKKLNGDKRYDFYIPSLNLIIETHGRQHYDSGFNLTNKTLEDEQENDKLKEILAKENRIDNYVIIDCRYSNLEFIKDSILKSELVSFYDLVAINWLQCHEYACNSLVKESCDLWNNGIKNINQISKMMKMSEDTIRRYLKMGRKVNLCDYDPKEYKGFLKDKIEIVQLSLDGDFIKEFPSIAAVYKEFKFHSSYISGCCSGKYKRAYGFIWMYKSNYEETKRYYLY